MLPWVLQDVRVHLHTTRPAAKFRGGPNWEPTFPSLSPADGGTGSRSNVSLSSSHTTWGHGRWAKEVLQGNVEKPCCKEMWL